MSHLKPPTNNWMFANPVDPSQSDSLIEGYLVHTAEPACIVAYGRRDMINNSSFPVEDGAGDYYQKAVHDIEMVILKWIGPAPESQVQRTALLFEAASMVFIKRNL